MYEVLAIILFPIIYLYKTLFLFLQSAFSSYSLSIFLLSLIVNIVINPLQKVANNIEKQASVRINNVQIQVDGIDGSLQGEMRFREIEKIYKNNNFHPIENVKKSFPIFIVLPILISAYIFFTENIAIFNQANFFNSNLAMPDNLILGLNLLPFLIFFINFCDFKIRSLNNADTSNTYIVISAIICLLIYNMPLALTMYWAFSSFISMLQSIYATLVRTSQN
jgi:membrane protein insertase Oxa1/YidC/SpoIIIJ